VEEELIIVRDADVDVCLLEHTLYEIWAVACPKLCLLPLYVVPTTAHTLITSNAAATTARRLCMCILIVL
jgi:hypothetical protein